MNRSEDEMYLLVVIAAVCIPSNVKKGEANVQCVKVSIAIE
ncbi:MAG: hypothetical protein QN648_02120 [Nitrososphaeraceae archaeon]|nr:hypothetical protein [Nitrososphaeraceae archaeon]